MSLTKLILLLIFISKSVFSQEKFIKYSVCKGDSFYSISKKFSTSIQDIENANPTIKKNLKPNMVLLIPNTNYKKEIINSEIVHQVAPKETLYKVSKRYNVSVSSIKKANPEIIGDDLKVGLQLKIVGSNLKLANKVETIESKTSDSKTIEDSEKDLMIHEVLPKETKYGISKKYGVTITALELLNPEMGKELSVGTFLKIRTANNTVIKENEAIISETKQSKNEEISASGEPYAILIPIYEKTDLPDKLIQTASENIGTNYRGGGKDKGGFDCSGLMIYTFGTYDIKLPRTSSEQAQFGKTISIAESQKGDLIFFSTNGSGNINHVGMITEIIGDEIKFIHSSSSNGVMISSNKESYYAKNFKKISRVLK